MPEDLKDDTQTEAWERAEGAAVKRFPTEADTCSSLPALRPPLLCYTPQFPTEADILPLPPRPPLLEAVFLVDAVPHPPCRGALVASVPLWVQQQVHVLRSRGALICREQQEDSSVSLLTYTSLPAHTAAWLTPVTALDPEFVQLGQVTQERKEQLLPFLWHLKVHSRNATFSTLVITTQE